MPEYRRWRLERATYFFTIVTHERRPIFADSRNVELLRRVIAKVQQERPFEIEAAVVLPDHLHFLWALPPREADFSGRISRIKTLFTRSFQPSPDRLQSLSRKRKRESTVWQRRFWERMIRAGRRYPSVSRLDSFQSCKAWICGLPPRMGRIELFPMGRCRGL